jgi:hypothetical protein
VTRIINEPAERLRSMSWRITGAGVGQQVRWILDQALAAERRATVERIRDLLGLPHTEKHTMDSGPQCQVCTGDWLEDQFQELGR